MFHLEHESSILVT